jgi:hypothetical protein
MAGKYIMPGRQAHQGMTGVGNFFPGRRTSPKLSTHRQAREIELFQIKLSFSEMGR